MGKHTPPTTDDDTGGPSMRATGGVVRTGFVGAARRHLDEQGRETLAEWLYDLQPARNYSDEIRVVDEHAAGVGWAEPDPDPLPAPAPATHRSGTCFDNESEEMRSACVEPIRALLEADVVLHEVRHQHDGYHTDLVYADVDREGLRARQEMTVGTDPIHDPLQRFKVWWSLYENGPRTRTDAVENGYYTKPSKNRKHLDWLIDHGYVGQTATGVCIPLRPPRIADLHAVELKRRDWETALKQAARANRAEISEIHAEIMGPRFRDRYGYADYRWVALDAGAMEPALAHAERFRDRGVGLLGITEGGTVVKHIDAAEDRRERYTRDRAYIESQVWERVNHSAYDCAADPASTAEGVEATETQVRQPGLEVFGAAGESSVTGGADDV